MPRNTRNFWIALDVDGKKTPVGTGPTAKDGGFAMTIFQREDGKVVTAAKISGVVTADGALRLAIRAKGLGSNALPVVATVDTKR